MACEFFVVGWGFKSRKTIKEQSIFLTYITLLWIFGHMIYHLISQMCWAEVSFVNTKLSKNRSIQTILLSGCDYLQLCYSGLEMYLERKSTSPDGYLLL